MSKKQITAGLVAASTILLAATTASAETGRYTMTPTKDGVLKLDTKTGAVSMCRRSTSGWSCEAVESKGNNLQARIDRLERENDKLRAGQNGRSKTGKLAQGEKEGSKIELPSEEDVDKAMDFMERLLQRFKGMVEDLKKDKKEEDGVPL